MIKECRTDEDFRQLLTDSHEKAVFLFKHSTACPVSRGACNRIEEYAESESQAEFWQILVRENKDLARGIADETGIEHKSPQVILFRNGKAVWDCSHHAINERNLGQQLNKEGA